MYASLAQAFSNDVEPFALRGAVISGDQVKNRHPYLTEEQAADLMKQVTDSYSRRTGSRPSRVVIHNTSQYQEEEATGFEGALMSEVPACDLIWLAPTGFRLLRRGMQEPWRGTVCTIGDSDRYLFTTGFVPDWREYPGPHVPSPLQIGSAKPTDFEERAKEILALTKMNWNSAEGMGRNPITISFSRKVGTIMTELGDDAQPNPLYRFYM